MGQGQVWVTGDETWLETVGYHPRNSFGKAETRRCWKRTIVVEWQVNFALNDYRKVIKVPGVMANPGRYYGNVCYLPFDSPAHIHCRGSITDIAKGVISSRITNN